MGLRYYFPRALQGTSHALRERTLELSVNTSDQKQKAADMKKTTKNLASDYRLQRKNHEKVIILFDVIITTQFPIVIINYIIMHQLKPIKRALKALFCSPPQHCFLCNFLSDLRCCL